MITLRLVAAGNPTKSPDGALGLLVFLGLAVLVIFLFRSMTKHLRKASRINYDEDVTTPPSGKADQPRRPSATASRRGARGGRPPTPRAHP
jgi:hypothetical protein